MPPGELSTSMGTLVSIVIPCHNHARYLRRAVESVLAQTYPDFEIVIVNDGSTDETHDVAEQLISEHSDANIMLLEQEQQGASRAMNVGVAASSGAYLLTLGADDTIEPEMLAETVAEMDADSKCGIVYTYTTHRCDPDDPPEPVFKDAVQEYPEFDLAYWVRHNPQLDACSLTRRTAFDETGGLDPDQFAEDLDLWLGITKRGWRAKLVPKPLFNYWHHGGARESTESWTQPIELRWQLIGKHPELYDEGERLFVASLMLGFVAADIVEVTQTLADSAENGLDWTMTEDRVRRLKERFAGLLAECEKVADAEVSAGLADATKGLLGSCRSVDEAFSRLANDVHERAFDQLAADAEDLQGILPSIGERVLAVHGAGMAEIYGSSQNGSGRMN